MLKYAALCVAIFLLLPTQVLAISSNWQRDGAVDVRLISSLEGVGQKTIIPLGLDVKMEPGWHTYWRSPGVAGLPPDFDWSKSQTDEGNVRQATILYPAPHRFTDHDMETIGYEDHVIFPIDVEVRQPGHKLAIETTLHLLACSTLCVPKTYVIELTVPQRCRHRRAGGGSYQSRSRNADPRWPDDDACGHRRLPISPMTARL